MSWLNPHQIFRQAEDSAIVTNAHLINAGELPELLAAHRAIFSFF